MKKPLWLFRLNRIALFGMTALVVFQIVLSAIQKGGADSLLIAFGILFVTLANEEDKIRKAMLFSLLGIACSIGYFWFRFG